MALLEVQVDGGRIEGLPANNQMVSVFKGVPFAAPPVGDRRWRRPEPVEPWQGTLEAFRFRDICTQPRFSSEGGNTLAATEFYVLEHPMSEDCLYLNVWTSAKSAGEKMPVAIYIHGGGFEGGFSYLNAYDGEGFAKRGIVVVTISYRLNFFGFLSHPELAAEDPDGSTGNYGLLDQIAAIEWVKRNIAAFGGDPGTITIFGQSAGGSSVQDLCASPLAQGLFHRAIMQSGGGVCRGGILEPASMEEAVELGTKFIGFAGYDSIADARKATDSDLLENYLEFKKANGLSMPVFEPAVDGCVLPETAYDYFRAGSHPDIDYMIGCAADEMRNRNAKAPPFDVARKIAERRFGKHANAYLQAIRATDPEETRRYYEDFFGDETLAGGLAWCENQLELGRRPSYMYYFTYEPPGAGGIGAHHSVEHHYVFGTLVRSLRPYAGVDFDLSEELAGYWANFIKNGDPNRGDGSEDGVDRTGNRSAVRGIAWTPYTKESPRTLDIGTERKMVKLEPNAKVRFYRDFSLERLS